MNTLLLFGSAQMNAFCPYCGRALEHRPGKAPEIVLPFFARPAPVRHGCCSAWSPSSKRGTRTAYCPPHSGLRHDPGTQLGERDPTVTGRHRQDRSQAPRSYVIRLMADRKSRILHMFDAAGELFYTSERTQELRYLSKAETFILVVDPLSVPSFWDQLPAGSKPSWPACGRTPHHRNWPISRPTWRSRRWCPPPVGAARHRLQPGRPDRCSGRRHRHVGHGHAGLGNLVRSAQLNFKEAAFFFTAAVMAGDVIHESISTLLRWVLRGHGIDPPREGPS